MFRLLSYITCKSIITLLMMNMMRNDEYAEKMMNIGINKISQ